MRSPVGRYATALMNGEKSAAHGNLRLGSFAGLSMGPIARVMCRKAGIRRWSCVDSVKYFDYSYRSFNVSGPLHKTSECDLCQLVRGYSSCHNISQEGSKKWRVEDKGVTVKPQTYE